MGTLRIKTAVLGSFLFAFLLAFTLRAGSAQAAIYGEELCNGDTVTYRCYTVQVTVVETEVQTKKGPKTVQKKVLDTWDSLFPDEREREIVMKLNRLNIRLRKGMVIAIPKDMTDKTFMDYSPYPVKLEEAPGRKLIIWDPGLLAWGAFDPEGNLVRWGPAVGGKGYCPDVHRGCRTAVGTFRVISRNGPNYRSGKYPVGCHGSGCARMPYAMFFKPGYAFHASTNVPGANASHGCVRLFYEDAKWLNQEFGEIGAKVIIRPYPRK